MTLYRLLIAGIPDRETATDTFMEDRKALIKLLCTNGPHWMHLEIRNNFIAHLRRWTECRYALSLGGTPIYDNTKKNKEPRLVIPLIMEAMLHFAGPDSWMGMATLNKMEPQTLMDWDTVKEWEHVDYDEVL